MRRMVTGILVPLALAYLAVCVLVFVLQSGLVYYPGVGREASATPREAGLAYETVSLRAEDGETLHGWWVPAVPARGTVIFFHGNAGNVSHRLPYLQGLHGLGLSTLIVDYRGYGRSTGRPSEEGTYRDAWAAWEYAQRERGVTPERLVLFGESLGAGVATWLATRVTPRALVLQAPFTSVNDLGSEIYWFLPVRLLSRFGYDNVERVRGLRTPLFVAHSVDDEIVPYRHGRRVFEAAAQPDTFVSMRGGHNDAFIFGQREWTERLAAFLERVLEKR